MAAIEQSVVRGMPQERRNTKTQRHEGKNGLCPGDFVPLWLGARTILLADGSDLGEDLCAGDFARLAAARFEFDHAFAKQSLTHQRP